MYTAETLLVAVQDYFSQPGATYAFDPVARQCYYRTDDGKKCAFGVAIPDEMYDPDMEGTCASEVLRDDIGLSNLFDFSDLKYGCDETFVDNLQSLHDKCAEDGEPMTEFLAKLKNYAAQYGFTI